MGTENELIQTLKAAAVLWYPFRRDGRLLLITDEEDSGHDLLRSRVSEMEAVKPSFIPDRGEYDYIVCLSLPEREEMPKEFLGRCVSRLNSSGTLLFTMNNRLGIRYFCGDRDPYTEHVFDGIDNYYNADSDGEKTYSGRMYARAEMESMLRSLEVPTYRFYSIYSGLEYPLHIAADGYVPHEDLANRILPVYHFPGTVFMEEERLYGTLVDNGLFHAMANAYVVECAMKTEDISDVLYVTSSLDRSQEEALITVIHDDNTVTKSAVFKEGERQINRIVENQAALRTRGIMTVDTEFEENGILMPYIDAPTGQKYLQSLLRGDKMAFLKAFDEFMELIEKSASIIGSGEYGPIADKVYIDLIPLNSFFIDGEYVVFDQEFVLENYPINVAKARVLFTFFAFHDELRYVEDELFKRYGLTDKKELYSRKEREFLNHLLRADRLEGYRRKIRRNSHVSEKNRQRMNYPAACSQKDYHIGYVAGAFDVFHIGHLNLLRRAKERCDYLIAGVMSDERMYDLKKKYPIIPCNERMQVVSGCKYVDQVEELSADRAGIMDAYNMFHFDCMFSGDDHANDASWLAERERLRERGSDIVFVSYTKETSSSEIRQKMKDDAEKVLLGDKRLLTDKNYRWIYTYDYAPESVWDEWRADICNMNGEASPVKSREAGGDAFPLWIKEEADAVAGRLHCVGDDTDHEGLPTYILLSDSHFAYNGTWDDTMFSMKAILERNRLNGIIHLGDLTDGLLPLARTEEIENKVMSDMRSLGVPVHVMPGNHDYNYFRGNPEIRYPYKQRFYIDDKNNSLRLIFIDSFDPKEEVRYGFSIECLEWLDNALISMPEGNRSIVFSHVPPLVRLQAWTKDIRNRGRLIDVLDHHADKIMALISGHSHCDLLFNDLHNRKFPIVLINCAKCEYFLEHKPKDAIVPFRRLGDRTQESFDIMQVDIVKNEIYFTRFGAGRDRVVRNHKAEWM